MTTSAWWQVTDMGQVARGKEAKSFAPFVHTSVQKKIGTTEAVAASGLLGVFSPFPLECPCVGAREALHKQVMHFVLEMRLGTLRC